MAFRSSGVGLAWYLPPQELELALKVLELPGEPFSAEHESLGLAGLRLALQDALLHSGPPLPFHPRDLVLPFGPGQARDG